MARALGGGSGTLCIAFVFTVACPCCCREREKARRDSELRAQQVKIAAALWLPLVPPCPVTRARSSDGCRKRRVRGDAESGQGLSTHLPHSNGRQRASADDQSDRGGTASLTQGSPRGRVQAARTAEHGLGGGKSGIGRSHRSLLARKSKVGGSQLWLPLKPLPSPWSCARTGSCVCGSQSSREDQRDGVRAPLPASSVVTWSPLNPLTVGPEETHQQSW